MNVFLDSRWIGENGIGRFASVLRNNLDLRPLNIRGLPASPLEPIRLLHAMLFRTPAGACILSPGFNVPLFVVRQYIFSIMDLNHIDRPENSSFFKRMYYRWIMRPAARRAFRILTISEFSRRRIIDWAGVDAQRVVNVGCGVDSSYHVGVQPFRSGSPYLLCVSNRKAHKNESRVVEAFSQARINTDIRLIFTGTPDKALLALCRKYAVESRVVFAGKVPEVDMPGLYRGALALVFPSLYEGFGLPVIEAMACGTPVLTSNTTSLPEVAGDAALLVDPLSVGKIAAGIHRLCSDDSLRESLIHKGLRQASLFKWDEVVVRVKAVLDQSESSR